MARWKRVRQYILCTFSFAMNSMIVPTANADGNAIADVALAVGDDVSCILLASGQVRCWGNNKSTKFSPSAVTQTAKPLTVPLPLPARLLRARGYQICALLVDGTVQCWGQWLPEPKDPAARWSPVLVTSDAIDLTVGAGHACALHRNGTVSCWGLNRAGDLGDGTNISRPVAALVSGLANVVHIGADDQTCALVRDGTLWCWGEEEQPATTQSNLEGYVGPALGLLPPGTAPTTIDVARVRRLRVGPRLVCVLYVDDTASCYGGILAHQHTAQPLVRNVRSGGTGDPRRVVLPVAWKSLRDITFERFARCWVTGDNVPHCRDDDKSEVDPEDVPAFGDGDHTFPSDGSIHRILRNVKQLEMGQAHRCASQNGTDAAGMPNVWCWGVNEDGEVGRPPREGDYTSGEMFPRPVRVKW